MTITGLQVERLIRRSFTKIFNSMHVLNQITTLKNILAVEKKVNMTKSIIYVQESGPILNMIRSLSSPAKIIN